MLFNEIDLSWLQAARRDYHYDTDLQVNVAAMV